MQIGIYIHIPFCITKCPYCAFNSYEIGEEKDYNLLKPKLSVEEKSYTEALVKEIETRAKNWKEFSVKSIFFGGGTPSLFSGESINTILASVKNNFELTSPEITLETNPHSICEPVDIERLGKYKNAGINRISMGAQSFRDEKLKFLGRLHKEDNIYSSYQNLQSAGFNNINLDLIFATKLDTLESWSNELSKAIKLGPKHLSCYCLSIEPGTVFEKIAKKKDLSLQSDQDLSGDLYSHIQTALKDANYHQYEVSNYAKLGNECIHNLAYWNSIPYLGFGAGSHSYDGDITRHINFANPKQYVSNITKNSNPYSKTETLSLEELETEFFYTRARLSEGISTNEYKNKFKQEIEVKHKKTISKLISHNLIKQNNTHLLPTQKGLLLNDSIVELFVEGI